MDEMRMMPLIGGPIAPNCWEAGAYYRERQMLALQYRTDPHAIERLLPPCFKPHREPIVTVTFIDNNGVDFMAGHGYRIAAFMVQVGFEGRQHRAEGHYALVMFENDTLPIVLGREVLGVHKMFADISSIRVLANGHLRCEASLWGHLLFGIEVGPLSEQDETVREAAGRRAGELSLMGYKYVPSLDGQPDAAYPLSTPSDGKYDRLWLGDSGELFFGKVCESDLGTTAAIIDALRTLPLVKVVGASRTLGSTVLRVDLSHRLL